MKGERTIDDKPFRYGGNIYSPSGTLLKKTYPYIGLFRITKGKHKGMGKFRIMCRACAYDLGKGVIEMDGYTYTNSLEFSESKFKGDLKRGICWNCKHLRRFNGDLADWVCERKGSVVIDTRRRECDDMWESRQTEREGE